MDFDEIKKFNFKITDYKIEDIRKEAFRIIETNEKPDSFSLARTYVELVQNKIEKLTHEETLKVMGQNLKAEGDEEYFVDLFIDLDGFSRKYPDYQENFYRVLEYIHLKFEYVLEEIKEARIYFLIYNDQKKKEGSPSEGQTSAEIFQRHKIRWLFTNQLQILALFELLQESGIVDQDTMKYIGAILKNTSLNKNKPINGDTISKKKKEAQYIDKRNEYMEMIIGRLDDAFNILSKDNGEQPYLANFE